MRLHADLLETTVPHTTTMNLPDGIAGDDERLAIRLEKEILTAKEEYLTVALDIVKWQNLLFDLAGAVPLEGSAVFQHADLEKHADCVASGILLSSSCISKLEEATRDQSCSATWHAEHVGRLT